MKIPVALAACLLSACSTTVYNGAGEKLARFQSDLVDLQYTRGADGSVTLIAGRMSNGAPVLAAGKALAPAVLAWSAARALGETAHIVDAVRQPVP